MSETISKIPANRHDKFFRKAMEQPEVLTEFLQMHLPANLLQSLDLATIELMPKSFITDFNHDLIADLVCKIKILQQEGYLIFLVEQQSKAEKLMGFRILQYTCEIINTHLKTYGSVDKAIPLVIPLVVYNGEKPYRYSTDLRDYVNAPRILVDQYFLQPFQLIDLTQIADAVLKEKIWAGVVFLALKHVKTAKVPEIVMIMELVSQIDKKGESRFSAIVLQYVFELYDYDVLQELLSNLEGKIPKQFEEKIMTMADVLRAEGRKVGFTEGEREGIRQGIQQGIKQGALAVGLRMLAMGMSLEEVSALTNLDREELAHGQEQAQTID